MKDLKHLYYFEGLLDDANNELVRKAQEKGRKEGRKEGNASVRFVIPFQKFCSI